MLRGSDDNACQVAWSFVGDRQEQPFTRTEPRVEMECYIPTRSMGQVEYRVQAKGRLEESYWGSRPVVAHRDDLCVRQVVART